MLSTVFVIGAGGESAARLSERRRRADHYLALPGQNPQFHRQSGVA